LLRHPRRYAGDRVIGLRDDDQFSAAVGESPNDQHGLAASGMERIVDPVFNRWSEIKITGLTFHNFRAAIGLPFSFAPVIPDGQGLLAWRG
jgi:hypothetical protein